MSAPLPDCTRLTEALLATWPAASLSTAGAWTIRDGAGGGSRVSSATANWPVTEADLPKAEAAMTALGQTPQFMVRAGEDALDALDALLEHHGYAVKDPTNLWAVPVEALIGDGQIAPGFGYAIWPPLAIHVDIWEEGDIGPARRAVMERAPGPKTALIGRTGNDPGGVGFVAIDGDIAMIHALHVLPDQRRRGVARQLIKQAAIWAEAQNATTLGLAVTRGNTAANPLYADLGMTKIGGYHYRIKTL